MYLHNNKIAEADFLLTKVNINIIIKVSINCITEVNNNIITKVDINNEEGRQQENKDIDSLESKEAVGTETVARNNISLFF